MFIFTAKLHRGRLALGLAAAVLVCGAVLAVSGLLADRDAEAVSANSASPKGIKTNEDRIAYLESYGWTVEPQALAV